MLVKSFTTAMNERTVLTETETTKFAVVVDRKESSRWNIDLVGGLTRE